MADEAISGRAAGGVARAAVTRWLLPSGPRNDGTMAEAQRQDHGLLAMNCAPPSSKPWRKRPIRLSNRKGLPQEFMRDGDVDELWGFAGML